jgi:hypothetical protein
MIRSLHAPHTLDKPVVRAAVSVGPQFVGTTTSFAFGLTGLAKNVTYTCQLLLGTVVQAVTSASYTGGAGTVTSSNNTISINIPAGTGTADVLGITVVSPVRTTGTYSLKVSPPTGAATTIKVYYDTAFGWSLTPSTTVTGNELITGNLVISGRVVSVQDIIIGGRSLLQIING